MNAPGGNRFPRGDCIKPSAFIDERGEMTVGEGVYIGHEVIVLNHEHDLSLRGDWYNSERDSSLVIGDRAYIGIRAMILSQVTRIGRDAIVGAGAVVTRNVADREIVGGNPAKHIGWRE